MVRLSVIDTETGEVHQVGEIKGTGLKRKATWFKGMIVGSARLSLMDLSSSDFKVYHAMLGMMKYGNRVVVNQTKLSESLSIRRETISRSLSSLEKHRIIERKGRSPNSITYIIGSGYVWCGSDVNEKEG